MGYKIAITGQIGSGKSTIAIMFRKYGYKVINADKIGHKVLKQQKNSIVNAFGKGILTGDKIDRAKLRKIAFSSKKNINKLNSLTHKFIIEEIKNIKDKLYQRSKKIIIEAAVLFEMDAHKLVDKIILVKCDRKNQLKRNKTVKDIKKIIKNQMPQAKMQKYADFIIDNNGSLAYTKRQVSNLILKINNHPTKNILS